MKRKFAVVFIITVLICAFAAAAWASEPIKLVVNGQEIKPDVSPQIIGDRTMVPVRWIAEALGAKVEWDAQTRTVIITSNKNDPGQSDSDQAAVNKLVEDFGKTLKNVSLTAPEDVAAISIKENYADYVSPALLAEWQNDPANAPGKVTSSPWPERIDIIDTERLSDSQYQVKGEIIEMTSTEMVSGGYAAKRPVILAVEKTDSEWFISAVKLNAYQPGDPLKPLEKSVIAPDLAEKIIKDRADQLIYALKTKDAAAIADFAHPAKGVRFTPYTYVQPKIDQVFSREDLCRFFEDDKVYLWGHYDGSGHEIKLTPGQYYGKFVYDQDYINAEAVGYNEVLSSGNMLENQFEVYEDPIVVEYYFSGFNPDYAGMDWRSLRLVFEPWENDWKVTGIINNQWTI